MGDRGYGFSSESLLADPAISALRRDVAAAANDQAANNFGNGFMSRKVETGSLFEQGGLSWTSVGVGGVGIDASAVTFRSTVPSEITGKGIKNEKLSQPGADAADSRLVSEYCQIRVAIISIQCGAGEFDLASRQARKKAIEMSSAIQLHSMARGLQLKGDQAQAFDLFRINIARHPDNWLVHSEIARIACAKWDGGMARR